jgi:hypothetical protein
MHCNACKANLEFAQFQTSNTTQNNWKWFKTLEKKQGLHLRLKPRFATPTGSKATLSHCPMPFSDERRFYQSQTSDLSHVVEHPVMALNLRTFGRSLGTTCTQNRIFNF